MNTAEQREYDRVRKQRWIDSLTPERRAEIVKRRIAQRSAVRAAKALVEGRVPGKPGKKALSLVEKKLANKANYERWKNKDIAEFRKNDAERHRQYYPFHKEEGAVYSRNRRAKLKNCTGTHTKTDIRELFFEQKGLCGLCDLKLDANNFHVDHWKPLAKGGSNDKGNLKLLHPRCNLMKSDKLPEELVLRINKRSS